MNPVFIVSVCCWFLSAAIGITYIIYQTYDTFIRKQNRHQEQLSAIHKMFYVSLMTALVLTFMEIIIYA
jgi:cell division protein FtsL